MGKKKEEKLSIVSPFLSPEQAADFLKVSVATIYGWSHRRRRLKFPVRKHGSKSVFLAEELIAWSDWRNGKGPEPQNVA